MIDLSKQRGHCCPWCDQSKELPVRLEKAQPEFTEHTGEEFMLLTECGKHPSMIHDDNSSDFCWCEK